MAEYIVQKGDTLSGIAQKVGLGNNWQALGYSGDPKKLQIGTKLSFGGSDPVPTPAAPAPVAAPTPAPTNSLDGYINEASKQITPGYDEAINVANKNAETAKSTYDKLAENTLKREPLVRQTYANLAAEFGANEDREMGVANRIGEQNIGAATVAVAATGMEAGQGSFRAPITAAQDKLLADVGSIADKYNLKQETLTSEMNSSIQDLYDKAENYTLTGQKEYTNAMYEIVKLKIDQKKDVLALAQQMFGDDMEVKKFKYQIEQDQKAYDLKIKENEEQKRQFEVSQANENARAAASLAASKANAVASDFKSYKVVPQDEAKGEGNGLNFFDANGAPISAYQYSQAGNLGIQGLANILNNSKNPDDHAAAKDILDSVKKGVDPNAIMAKYPSIFH
jgi:LysM repeat protein